jgi:superfamily II DNA/RNA helicase
VQQLLHLARWVEAQGDESKLERLRGALREAPFPDEKVLVFTGHRDTLEFLVRRLEGLGFAGQVAQLHGGMDYRERDEQVAFFRRPAAEGGARFLVATDAAGEGINLQFCWLVVNYDVPWNPARLEQRMGRVHRYGQKHDPVFIANLVAGRTREGRVLQTLLDKLERIRRELGSDKVFDVFGRLFEGVSLREYMEQALTEDGADVVRRRLEGTLTKEQVTALAEREKRLYGDGGGVTLRPASAVRSRYYLRAVVADRPGVLADIARELAEHQISISSVIQHEALEEQDGAPVPLVIMTHTALTGSFRAAVAAIDRLGCVAAPSVYYPVAD